MTINLENRKQAAAYRTYCRAFAACERALGRVPGDWRTLAAISPSWRITLRRCLVLIADACNE
ncbi:hypothetical protein NG895_05440 [Aeoliella sp. ICT_H6.2]|uniref:Uncharacterized protein n=1 Tax=Aeoliella straminimaris TaxID=2954799 RepID=A0A9X2F7M3_9BACT|nr:hypothetical protein [Aeoliella straminimaris]MCO6043344.1 hypothetical protein [Aeoliella straminimaris]